MLELVKQRLQESRSAGAHLAWLSEALEGVLWSLEGQYRACAHGEQVSGADLWGPERLAV